MDELQNILDSNEEILATLTLDDFKKALRLQYKNTHGGKDPGGATAWVIDQLDEAVFSGYVKSVKNSIREIARESELAIAKMRWYENQIHELIERGNREKFEHFSIKEAIEQVQDQRLKDALNVYRGIVSMNFDKPEQKTANIKNASYIFWALYGNGAPMPIQVPELEVVPETDKRAKVRF